MFTATSRYFGLPIKTLTASDGTPIPYIARRFVPPPSAFDTLYLYTVTGEDRLDLIAARYLGDPQQYWRIADGNGAVDPFALLVVGQLLRITLPEGIPASATTGAAAFGNALSAQVQPYA